MEHHNTHDGRSHDEYLGCVNEDRCAPGCDDQRPVVSKVGRGIHGDDYRVEVIEKRPVDPLVPGWKDQSPAETYLEGKHYDHTTKTWTTDWVSENVSGGYFFYQYNLRPWTNPATFTITWIYRRPENPLKPGELPGNDPDEWSWTSPAIPYYPSQTGNEDGNVGSGIATMFVRTNASDPWEEMLIYPPGTTREDFNAPDQGEPWTVNLDLSDMLGDFIDIDEIAKIIGVSKTVIQNIINNTPGAISGSDNVKDYIDDRVSNLTNLINALTTRVTNLENTVEQIMDLLPDTITNIINNNMKLAVGNINLYGKTWGGKGNVIMTHDTAQTAAQMREGDQLGRPA